jgi:uncharacterized protein
MKMRVHDPRCLDVAAAAADGARLNGSWPLAGLERLAEGSAEAGEVAWSVHLEQRGRAGAGARACLHLDASANVMRECQRCLRPVELRLAVDRDFTFAADEETAAALDAHSEDDVLALTRCFDLRTLVEDELLLALPLVPRHERCPVPLATTPEPAGNPPSEHPFAALAALKRAPSS